MGKGGQGEVTPRQRVLNPTSTKPTTNEKQEVLINDRYYDVTGWKHPGGSVIKLYAGKDIDATQAFENFHIRSKKARKFLESRPSRAATDVSTTTNAKLPGQAALLADFDQLTRDLTDEGFFKPAPLHVLYCITEIIFMHALGIYWLFKGSSVAMQALGVVVLGIVQGRCGWFMHEGGHYSLTGNIPLDRTLQIIFYGTGCGMSGGWWRTQHNKHHSMPQKHGADPDLNTLPLVAFTEKVVKKIGVPMKLWLRMQSYLFVPVTCQLVALGWQFFLHPRHIVRTKNMAEAAAIGVRLLFWHVCITGTFGVPLSIGIYLTDNWIGAVYIFANFAVSHTHLPVVPKDDDKVDWVRYAAIHTMNVSPGPLNFVNWWMSYLNFQIEHHLFPSMPQFRHPIISGRVRELFEKHGLKYDQRGYWEAMRVTFRNLDEVGSDVFYG